MSAPECSKPFTNGNHCRRDRDHRGPCNARTEAELEAEAARDLEIRRWEAREPEGKRVNDWGR